MEARRISQTDERSHADAFDNLVFLRSLTQLGSSPEPTPTISPSGAAPSPSSKLRRTRRYTEFGTMSQPTEW